MNTINIKLYDTLRKELGLSEEKSRAITQAIEETVLAEMGNTQQQNATKLDIEQLRKEIADTKVELIKWMFTFWIGTIGIAILFYFLKK
ncbi:hypothetical protein A9P82_02570 [Arachidicoccus ginsenosidimutans]|uniref:hypothetical protein n=1 Tax=Arachidicoccus sp. BS20 TaxID=1850526 RepID=UPI0007F0D328|nr:hypothetical protein [Arachidicoccus sp. BS20]ANI88284.1 hypothetical protein A9P82_02570 [Arachidicoccus sp. BS20]